VAGKNIDFFYFFQEPQPFISCVYNYTKWEWVREREVTHKIGIDTKKKREKLFTSCVIKN
jgi:hypothetical protein